MSTTKALSAAQRKALAEAVATSDGSWWLREVRDVTVQVLWERGLVEATGRLRPAGVDEALRLKAEAKR